MLLFHAVRSQHQHQNVHAVREDMWEDRAGGDSGREWFGTWNLLPWEKIVQVGTGMGNGLEWFLREDHAGGVIEKEQWNLVHVQMTTISLRWCQGECVYALECAGGRHVHLPAHLHSPACKYRGPERTGKKIWREAKKWPAHSHTTSNLNSLPLLQYPSSSPRVRLPLPPRPIHK